MPFTFSHSIAVLPLRRFCPSALNFAALVVGTMAPDFGYYLRQFPAATFAHTLTGTFLVCFPSGMVVLGLFYLLREPLAFMLPQPHRGALMPWAMIRPSFGGKAIFSASASILVGAWTHTIWDSFTHRGGWAVERLEFLRASLFHLGGTDFPAYYVLQEVSTFGGGAVLAVAYFQWLGKQRGAETASAAEAFSDRSRHWVLGGLLAVALAIALPSALGVASYFHGYFALRVFIFRAVVYTAAAFLPLLAFSALALYAVHRRNR